MKKIKLASIIMIVHGMFFEIVSCLCLIPIVLKNTDMNNYISFIVPYFKDNMILMLISGLIYGVIRIIGAVGLLNNKMWGLVLSIIICSITIALMMFMLPAGIIDGLLSTTSLVLILIGYYNDKKINN